MLLLSFFLLSIGLVSRVAGSSVRSGVSFAPELDDGDTIQFFVMESSFPFNTPQNIRDTAGKNFQKYAITHAGLGVWDITSDEKFTIEFVSVDYVGSLLPNFDEVNKRLLWNNTGNIVFTSPTQQSDWLSAHMICETTGVTYNQLLTYLDNNEDLFTVFQPVQAVYYNETEITQTVDFTSTQLQNRVKVSKKDSFWFVNLLVQQLNTYGADTQSFLDIYGSTFQYITENVSPEVISWEGTSSLNSVYQWYKALDQCYQSVFDASENADAFLTHVKSCYGDFAYIYKTDNSVYNVSLRNLSTVYATPDLQRYIFDLPDSGDKSKHPLQTIDIIVIVVAALLILIGAGLILRRICVKKPRRRVSMDGEQVATRVVDSLAGEHLHDDHEQKVYYRGRPSSWSSMWGYMSANNNNNSSSNSKHGGLGGSSHRGNTDVNNNNSGLAISSSSVSQHYSEDSDNSTSELVRPLAAGTVKSDDYADDTYANRAPLSLNSASSHGRGNSSHGNSTHGSNSTHGNSSHGGYVSPHVPGVTGVNDASYTTI